MSFMNKVKNFFYEDVEEDVEETRVEEPKKKFNPFKKEPKVEEKVSEEVRKNVKQEANNDLSERELFKSERTFNFPMDLGDEIFDKEEPEVVTKQTTMVKNEPVKESYTRSIYRNISKEEPKVEEKKKFRPSPVISPVYGILDKNYKKEDVVSKREIRLSTPSNKKLDLDTIREKAYGDLSIDISNSMEEVVKEEPTTEVTEDTVYDLNTNTSPEVEKVTIGDADEYYNELGLEYNVDYKDNSTKTTKRRSSPEPVEENVEVIDSESKEDKHEDTEELESNLFDLVDSMYEDKE